MSKNEYPLVSVIVPFFNEKDYIKECLESVLNQTYRNIELILIDDGSTDNSFNVIKNFIKQDLRVKYFKKKNSKTVANPRNYGVKKAKGKFLAFLDADDIWKNNKLELQLKKIKNNHLLSCTAANYRILRSNSRSNFFLNALRSFFQNFIIKKINHNKFWWLYVYNPIIVSSALVDKKVFNKFKFNEDLHVREDLDFWILLSKKKKNFISFNKEILVTITRKKNSLSSEYLSEFNKYINTVNKKINEFKDFKYLNYLFIGIGAKIIKFIIKKNYIFLRKNILRLFFIFSFFYFIIFYSPLFWYLGNSLLYTDNLKKTDAVLVSLGTGYTPYYNNSYENRYYDLLAIDNLPIKFIDIYIHGRKQTLPDQIILKSLLKNAGFNDDKIYLIFEERDSLYKNIVDIKILLKSKNIKSIIFITGPYNTLRAKLIWSKVAPEIEVLILKTTDWPIKNSFFERSINKKIIVYEHLSIIKTKLFLLN
jgi:teichuronic acid biosynthesis glycosyltransferase TuaG